MRTDIRGEDLTSLIDTQVRYFYTKRRTDFLITIFELKQLVFWHLWQREGAFAGFGFEVTYLVTLC